MTPKRAKYVREERNGKIVYVPSSERPSTSPTGAPPLVRAAGFEVVKRLLPAIAAGLLPMVWTGAGIATFGSIWFAWQTLTNPDVLFWVNQFTPGNLNRKIPADDQPKTIAEIIAQLERHDQKTGTPIPLISGFSFHSGIEGAPSVVIPIMGEQKDAVCPQGCTFIQELQVYRSLDLPKFIQLLQRQRRFRSVSRMKLQGPSDRDLNQLIRLVTRNGAGEGSDLPLGMSQIEQQILKDDDNIWLVMSGLRAKGNATASYGQLLHFSPDRSQLSVMLNWLSPTGQFPEWKEITGDGQPEIVIDQSVGLEPSFSVYRLNRSPNGSPWLTSVDLSKPAFATSSYQGAIKLANSGLWTQAQQQLSLLKQQSEDQWTSTAQDQLSLIQLHAEALKTRTDLVFSDPIEAIQTLLVQGNWTQAQRKLLEAKGIIPDLRRILASDNGQIGDRIQAAAQFGADPKVAIEWGILYHYSKGGKAGALNWVNANHPSYRSRIDPLIKQMLQPEPEASKGSQGFKNSPTDVPRPSPTQNTEAQS